MRKCCIAIAVFFAFVACVMAQQNFGKSWKVVHCSTESYAFDLKIQNVHAETAGNYVAIAAPPDFSPLQESGKPELPVFQQIIAVPQGAEPKLDFSVGERESISLAKPLRPAQPHQFKNRAADFVIDSTVYTSSHTFQKPIARIAYLGTMRGLRLFRITVSPFQYLPKEQRVLYYSDIAVRVTFAGADEHATAREIQRHGGMHGVPFANKAAFENLLSRNTAIAPKYVVVAQDTFAAALRPFLWWKRQKGFRVVEIYTRAGDTCTQIRSRLDSIYRAATPLDPAPSFLLIVGDVEHVPAFGGKVRITGLPQHSTDLYYAEYTGDFYPEVPYGRISVSDTAELRHVLKKTIEYENFSFADTAFLNRFTLVAGRESRPPAPVVTNGQINYLNYNYLSQNSNFDTHYFYNPDSDNQLVQIIETLDSGASLVNYTSHCLSTGWYQPTYTSQGVDTLSNIGKYFFAVNNCCLSSRFFESRCFGEALLRNPYAGAVGVIGASNETLWEEDYYWAMGAKGPVSLNAQYTPYRLGAFDRLWHTHGEQPSDFAPTAGEMLQAGNFGLTQMGMEYENYYWEIYNLLGDPSLMPYFGVPQAIALTLPDSVPVGASHLSIGGTPLARVAFVQDSQLLASVMLDGNGLAEVDLQQPLGVSPLLVTATAQFRKPLLDTVPTYVSATPRLSVVRCHVADTFGVLIENQLVASGRQYVVDFCIKNFGSDTAKNIQLALSSLDGRSRVYNVTNSRSELLAGDTACICGFMFIPDSGLADGATLSLKAMLTCNNGDTSQRCYNFLVRSAALGVGAVKVLRGGQPARRLAVGETYELKVPVLNSGAVLSDSSVVYALIGGSQGSALRPDSFVVAPLQALFSDTAEFVFSIGPSATTYIDVVIGIKHRGRVAETLLRLPVGNAVETFETANFATYRWDTTHANRWIIDTMPSHAFAGRFSARSATIDHKQRSELAITITTLTDDSITFWRRTSTEASADYLSFYIDGVRQGRWAGSGHYERMAFFVAAGTHTFSWIYAKDGSMTGGTDCVWIDDITFPLSQLDTAYQPPLPVGIAQAAKQNRCKVHPNPAQKFFIVENVENEVVEVEVMNAFGQIVDKKSILPEQQLYYNADKLRCGVYILLFGSKNHCYTEKIIISR